ncbi:MAG TPA: hypothetical protein VIH89_01075 [Candidatus Sulfotelmatobacter sp.]|jgi:hypothetical protein
MTPGNEDRIKHLLKQSISPTSIQPRAVLQRDLWTAMRHRLDEGSATVPWFDWALLAAVAVCLVLFPRAIPVLLYHL